MVVAALQCFNESMRRYEVAAALRDEAMLQSSEAIQRLQAALDPSDQAAQEVRAALSRQDGALQALLAFVPVAQAEIVRLDSRIDRIEDM